jgi:cathepsin D
LAVTKSQSISKRDYSFSIATAAPPTQSDSISIHQDGTDYSYFSPVAFGTSGKVMYLLVDTGATNTWLMGSGCKTKSCGLHHTFGKEDSSSLETTGATFGLGYGTGSVAGEIVNDTVAMGGLSIFATFGLAANVSDEFSLFPIDGILGLGRPGSGTPAFPAIMEAVIDSKVLDANLIGINLNRASEGTADGELNFGSPDVTKYSGDLSYVNTVSGSETWEISIDDIILNGIACNFTGKTAFIDTGTTLMLFPTEDAQRLHSLIPRSRQVDGVFRLPCSSDILIQIIISGISYNVRAEDYVGKPVEGGDLCSSNIVGGLETSANNQWILGDSFLKNVYTVFDFDKDRVGVSPTKQFRKTQLTLKRVWSQGSSSLIEVKYRYRYRYLWHRISNHKSQNYTRGFFDTVQSAPGVTIFDCKPQDF